MTKGIFSSEEYKKMYNRFIDQAVYKIEDIVDRNEFVGLDYEADNGMYVTLEAQFDHERSYYSPFDTPNDETWDIILTDIIDFRNIVVYESNTKGSKVVDNAFDKDAFVEANKDNTYTN